MMKQYFLWEAYFKIMLYLGYKVLENEGGKQLARRTTFNYTSIRK